VLQLERGVRDEIRARVRAMQRQRSESQPRKARTFGSVFKNPSEGPGAGALWGRAELLEEMEPFLTGGEMISTVSLERSTWNEIPWKFEAGTPAIAECIGLGAAVDYLQSVGMEAIEAHEQMLTRYGHDVLRSISGVTLFGPPPERRAGILTFNVADLHPHDVAQVLDGDAICVRAGHHCAQPVVDHFGVAATTRASVSRFGRLSASSASVRLRCLASDGASAADGAGG